MKRLGVGGPAVAGTKISTEHLELTTYPSDAAIAPGNRVAIAFDITPRRGMHVYAPGASGYRVISVRVADQPFVREDLPRAEALERAAGGYVAPQLRGEIRVGGEGVLAALKMGAHLAWRAGRISDHDKKIGEKLAWVLAGGNLIAMRPDPNLYILLGLTDDGTNTLSNAYLKFDTSVAPGKGLVADTIQFHGEADLVTVTAGSDAA